ncbi:hypothetical protein JNW90_34530 [Micromonospora sp. STR1s_5]|nr:hypothetical protein [Micromonospora sp. STR1s_5]
MTRARRSRSRPSARPPDQPLPQISGSASRYDRGDADTTRRCAMAKLFATEVGYKVADKALQMLGRRYPSEYGIEKLVRDLRVRRILEGTNEIMHVIVSRSLLGGPR